MAFPFQTKPQKLNKNLGIAAWEKFSSYYLQKQVSEYDQENP